MSAAKPVVVPGIGRRFGALVFDGVVIVSIFQGFLSVLDELVPSEFLILRLLPVFTIWWMYASVTEGLSSRARESWIPFTGDHPFFVTSLPWQPR